jgi:branched-chain amino acid transport system substrate-binding protein
VRNLVRFTATDDIQGRVAAQWASGPGGRQVAAVFHDGGRYGRCVAAAFADEFGRTGNTVVSVEQLPADPVTFSEIVDQVDESGADCVYIGAIATGKIGQLIRELRGRLPADRLTIIGPDGLDDPTLFYEIPADLEDELVITGPYQAGDLADSATGAAWLAGMYERVGEERDLDPYAISAFEITLALIQAIDAAGTNDRGAILDAMRGTRDFQGLTEPFGVDARGDRSPVLVRLARLQDNAFVTIGVESASSDIGIVDEAGR